MLAPTGGEVLVVPQLLPHQTLVWVAWVEAAWVVLTRVRKSLLHQLMPITVAVHLRPVAVLGRATQVTHWGGWIRCSLGHNRRPLVSPVSVLLHVLRQVSLLQWALVSHRLHIKSFPYLGVGLAAIGTDVSLHVF